MSLKEKLHKILSLVTKAFYFFKANGFKAMIERTRYHLQISREFQAEKKVKYLASTGQIPIEKFSISSPLRVYFAPTEQKRINLVIESIGAEDLDNKTLIAVIFSVLLAEKWERKLRIITRKERVFKAYFQQILKSNGLLFHKNVEFIFAPALAGQIQVEIDINNEDIFITESQQIKQSILQSVSPVQMLCLLDESTRLKYSEILNNIKLSNKSNHV